MLIFVDYSLHQRFPTRGMSPSWGSMVQFQEGRDYEGRFQQRRQSLHHNSFIFVPRQIWR